MRACRQAGGHPDRQKRERLRNSGASSALPLAIDPRYDDLNHPEQ